jgi:AcrR family transcriptional regulator
MYYNNVRYPKGIRIVSAPGEPDERKAKSVGLHERRQRERQARRQHILDAARQIAMRDGWRAVTIREVAALIEYSPPTIYEHFDGKDAILRQLMHDGYGLLLDALRAGRDDCASSEAQSLQLCQAFWDFACENSELYELMHGLASVPSQQADRPAEVTQGFAEVGVLIHTIAPDLDEQNTRDAEDLLWAMLHGLVSLRLNHWIPGGDDRARHLLERAVQQWLSALADRPESPHS